MWPWGENRVIDRRGVDSHFPHERFVALFIARVPGIDHQAAIVLFDHEDVRRLDVESNDASRIRILDDRSPITGAAGQRRKQYRENPRDPAKVFFHLSIPRYTF